MTIDNIPHLPQGKCMRLSAHRPRPIGGLDAFHKHNGFYRFQSNAHTQLPILKKHPRNVTSRAIPDLRSLQAEATFCEQAVAPTSRSLPVSLRSSRSRGSRFTSPDHALGQ